MSNPDQQSKATDTPADSGRCETWRVGSKVPINVYAGNRPVCQCHTEADAAHIVRAVNRLATPLPAGTEEALFVRWMEQRAPETLRRWRQAFERETSHGRTADTAPPLVSTETTEPAEKIKVQHPGTGGL